MKFKAAAIQMECGLGDPEGNLAKAEGFIRCAARGGADIVCLPEMFDSGYHIRWAEMHAREQTDKTKERLREIAAASGVHIVAGIANERRGFLYNSSFCIDPTGRIAGCYDKNSLFKPTHEDKFFQRGKGMTVISTPYCPIGFALCFDLRFPPVFSRQAKKGAKVIFVGSAWPLARVEHWRTLLRARALENQIYIVAADQVGKPGKMAFAGHSAVIDFDGNVLAEKKKGEGIVVAEIDLSALNKRRKELPLIQ